MHRSSVLLNLRGGQRMLQGKWAVTQPLAGLHYSSPPMPNLRAISSHCGCTAERSPLVLRHLGADGHYCNVVGFGPACAIPHICTVHATTHTSRFPRTHSHHALTLTTTHPQCYTFPIAPLHLYARSSLSRWCATRQTNKQTYFEHVTLGNKDYPG